MRRLRNSALIVLAVTVPLACGGRTVRTTASDPAAVDVRALWVQPDDLETRDLFAGPAAPGVRPPSADTVFTFLKSDTGGFSPGYDVRDPAGMTWSVKLGPEAQTEVVASRILWAIGYHQMPAYYLSDWTLSGGPEGDPGPGRFRPDLPDRKVVGEWSWRENDFAHTQPFRGLIVANLVLNNWDWKTSNNKVYDLPGDDGQPVRWFVVRDVGASLGKTAAPAVSRWLGTRIAQGNRNDIDDFERQNLIKEVVGEEIRFDYSGIYEDVIEAVTPADVVWASRLMARLSDAQLHDAFRAGGYPPDIAARYVTKIKAKIAEGLALARG